MTDPIADYLTRIRNGIQAKQRIVEIPGSNLKYEMTKVLFDKGYILNYKFEEDNKQGDNWAYFFSPISRKMILAKYPMSGRVLNRVRINITPINTPQTIITIANNPIMKSIIPHFLIVSFPKYIQRLPGYVSCYISLCLFDFLFVCYCFFSKQYNYQAKDKKP